MATGDAPLNRVIYPASIAATGKLGEGGGGTSDENQICPFPFGEIRIGYLGRLDPERSPGMFLQTAKHLLANRHALLSVNHTDVTCDGAAASGGGSWTDWWSSSSPPRTQPQFVPSLEACEIVFVMAGDGVLRERLQRTALRLGLGSSLRMVGRLPKTEVSLRDTLSSNGEE